MSTSNPLRPLIETNGNRMNSQMNNRYSQLTRGEVQRSRKVQQFKYRLESIHSDLTLTQHKIKM